MKTKISDKELQIRMEWLDKKILDCFSYLKYKELFFPITISEKNLEKINYIKSFEKYLFKVGKVIDLDKDSPEYLTPAACLHVYPYITNETINNLTVYSTKNKCFRNEEKTDSMVRKKEFTMREFIFLSSNNNEIVKEREQAMHKFGELISEIGVKYTVKLATDHFSDPDNKLKVLQKISKAKYEFLVKIDGNEFSIASFNLHGDHFTHSYGITGNKDNTIFSGCCAFGLERLAYCSLSEERIVDDRE
ncbi:hypothetical protein FZX01_03745 [Listeria monocytogenes]|uniref:aminoacyl--tRNA ligase-related protein n=1 Tax=Listeria monocytogenes TaxID=1639 RepID=UPI0011EA7AFC|nr:aminoacyl--tRNA ligase-related protein [Listeria monocytogenes]TYU88635.1 hypothetical protein FZX01_03745 [Listeria monocytogenes]